MVVVVVVVVVVVAVVVVVVGSRDSDAGQFHSITAVQQYKMKTGELWPGLQLVNYCSNIY